MILIVALLILALTVILSLTRPTIGRFRIEPPIAAVFGAVLIMAIGLLPRPVLFRALGFLSMPVLTIVSLMFITLVAERAGFFRLLAWRLAKAADGNGVRLFTFLFFTGTTTGALFTNDAAILIFTPMVFQLIEEVKEESWTIANKIPYYFAVIYVACVGAFVVSNPINLIVAGWFEIGFIEYARWMFLPAIISMIVTYFGLRFFFRRMIPSRFRLPPQPESTGGSTGFRIASGLVLLITLVGFFSEHMTGIPTGIIAAAGAVALAVVYRTLGRGSPLEVARGIGWDVIIFVVGIFLVVTGLRTAGFTDIIGDLILRASESGMRIATFATGYLAACCSAIMNNHPVASVMALAIRDLPMTEVSARLLAFAALIGGDLGPKMLPIGSLAALMWFRILRSRGIEVSYWLYIKIGVPITIVAIFISMLILNLESALY